MGRKRVVDPETVNELRTLFPVGSTAYTTVVKVSRSGLTRTIRVFAMTKDRTTGLPTARDVSGMVAEVLGWPLDTYDWGVKVDGCGMNMAFHLVYCLSRVLYPGGHTCTGSRDTKVTGRSVRYRCPSNDHSNDWGRLSREWQDEHGPDPRYDSSTELSAEERQEAVEAYCHARGEWIASQEPRLWSKRRKHSDGGYAINKRTL